MSVKQLREILAKKKVSVTGMVEKSELVDKAYQLAAEASAKLHGTKYNLIANIVHDSSADKGTEGESNPLHGGSYRVHINNRADDQWYEVQDLHVQEVMPQVIGLSESYMMVYERKKDV